MIDKWLQHGCQQNSEIGFYFFVGATEGIIIEDDHHREGQTKGINRQKDHDCRIPVDRSGKCEENQSKDPHKLNHWGKKLEYQQIRQRHQSQLPIFFIE